jgi:hypothetical protein
VIRELQPQASQPTPTPDSGLVEAGAGLAAVAPLVGAAVPVARNLAERAATVPLKAAGRSVLRLVPGANAVTQLHGVATGRKTAGEAVMDATLTHLVGKAATAPRVVRVAQVAAGPAQRAAGVVARGLGAVSGPAAAGMIAGAALPAMFLGALEHDANRRPEIPKDEWSLRASIFAALGGNNLRK